MNLKDRYAIVGIGYTPRGRIPDRTALSFYLEACANAIVDAGLERKDIDGLMCYRQFPQKPGEEEVTSYLVAQQLGLKPNVLSQEAKGPHFLANIVECASDEVYCDMPVEVTWEDVDEAFSLPKFKPHGDIGQKG